MFTGLVETLGTIASLERRGADATVRVECTLEEYVHGESIAVDGCCLSVTASGAGWFSAEASSETLAKTALGDRRVGDRVHLERAMRHDARLGGHLVTGHVDGVGTLALQTPRGEALELTFEVPDALAPFLAPKGSVCIDGVSLTLNRAAGNRFDVFLVPVTQAKTRLATLSPGARVNLEVDVLAKYVARMLGRPGVDGVPAANPGTGGVSLDLLQRQGYL